MKILIKEWIGFFLPPDGGKPARILLRFPPDRENLPGFF
jgi:hypothetical protein